MNARHYQELIVWQKAMDLVTLVYSATEGFPQKETFGLSNQMRRSAVSVPSNIAEGQGRKSRRDFLRFLLVSNGSLQELETQAMIARRLGYLAESQQITILDLCSEVGRLINGLCRSLSKENGS
jgi:four helix bundle protein